MAQLFGMPRLSARCHKCLIEATQLRMTCQEPQEKGKNGLVRVHTNRRLITIIAVVLILQVPILAIAVSHARQVGSVVGGWW